MKQSNLLQSFLSHAASPFTAWLARPQAAPEPGSLAQKARGFLAAEEANELALSSYYWIESSTLTRPERAEAQKHWLCCYNAMGLVKKSPFENLSDRQYPLEGITGRFAKSTGAKEESDVEIQINRLASLYLQSPLDALQMALQTRRVSFKSSHPAEYSMIVPNYLKEGDKMILDIDQETQKPRGMFVDSSLDASCHPFFIDVQYGVLPDGTHYPCLTTIGAPTHQIVITRRQSNFFKEPIRYFQPKPFAKAS